MMRVVGSVSTGEGEAVYRCQKLDVMAARPKVL
jgi:hypothetical protein